MSDISIHISWLDLLVAAPVFGWPGLIIGGVIGALLWSRRRILASILGALVGCAAWFFVPILLR